jgi:hypothetical protein
MAAAVMAQALVDHVESGTRAHRDHERCVAGDQVVFQETAWKPLGIGMLVRLIVLAAELSRALDIGFPSCARGENGYYSGY